LVLVNQKRRNMLTIICINLSGCILKSRKMEILIIRKKKLLNTQSAELFLILAPLYKMNEKYHTHLHK